MSQPLATYSFLPWLRQGLANQITAADHDPTVLVRASVHVELQLTGDGVNGGTVSQTVGRDVALFGPGDIVGIDTRAIVRTEPRHWITNFEPNYLAQVEFYDEDFPWRYTPAAPDKGKGRLRPWIMLVVLTEDEFKEGADLRNRPVPCIEVANLDLFPPASQLWAWAHVHVNRGVTNDTEIASNDMEAVLPRLQAVLNENPDLAYSRLVCPRKLAPKTGYHAFLIPVFETGRLAGLGLDPAGSPSATFSAWEAYEEGTRAQPLNFPYYHRWFFQTGEAGDFESLVRLLEPKQVDSRVGLRDMDVLKPGSNLPGITDTDLHGILKLGGALRIPRENYTPDELAEVEKYENWAAFYPHPFQESLARLINLSDDYATQSAQAANTAAAEAFPGGLDPQVANDPDPLITPPLYGTWHALAQRLLSEQDESPVSPNDNWVHTLNLDPRHRVAAGFGTRVVQEQQERYMDAAWEQVGKVLEANRRIRLAQLAKETSWSWYERHLLPLHKARPEKTLTLLSPVQKRVLLGGFTVHHQRTESRVQPALTSVAIRRLLRPRGRLLKAAPFEGSVQPENLLHRVNEGEVSAAPPKQTPAVATVDQVADAVLPQDVPVWLRDVLRSAPLLRFAPLAIALLLLPILLVLLFLSPCLLVFGLAALAGLVLLYQRLASWWNVLSASNALREEGRTPESVDSLPSSPDFVLTEPGSGFQPSRGVTDSVEATRFKVALRDSYALLAASAEVGTIAPKQKLELGAVALGALSGVNPELTFPKRVRHAVLLPPRLQKQLPEEFVEAMAYPEIDEPMYKPLAALSDELFLPNLNLIAPNSITLLETNQPFIEAYMVGLNHEFARELLWREYPTDQRGSYFRQFWDVKSFFSPGNEDAEALREKLRDIPPLHQWSKLSKLGDHDQREQAGEKEEEVVLVIRGELLKRYPTAVIYAHRAKWAMKDGKIDPTQERQLVELTPGEEAKPHREKVRTPLYEAKVEPDIHFFGFDLTAKTAKGGTGENPTDDPGWFFVIKERPGEPRFGLDIDQQSKLTVWNDLSWQDVQPGPAGSYIQISNATPTLTLTAPGVSEAEKVEQHADDKLVPFNKDMSSADLAYVLFQVPVLVAVHAAEMLRKR